MLTGNDNHLLTTFQNKKKLYLDAIGQGVFFPMPQINHFDYAIRFAGMDEPFGDGWKQKINYDGFNITVKNGLWVTDLLLIKKLKRHSLGY